MVPESMDSNPAIARSNVDFPHPDGPNTTSSSWAPISSDTLSSTTWSPKRLQSSLSATPLMLMIVARNALGTGDPLVFDRGFQHRSCFDLTDSRALQFLPRCLTLRERVATRRSKLRMPLLHLRIRHQHVDSTFAQINSDAITGAQNGESSTYGCLRRGVQDGRRPGSA